MFTTDRLILRAYREGDMDDLMRLSNNAQVLRGLSSQAIVPHGPKHSEIILDWHNKAIMVVMITLKSTGEFMGSCQIWNYTSNHNRDGQFGIGLFPEYWDKGYGTEVTRFMVDYAFRWLNLHRLGLDVYEGNERAVKVYKRM